MPDPRPVTEARPPLIGGLRPDTCTSEAHCCFCTEDEPPHGEPCDEPGCRGTEAVR